MEIIISPEALRNELRVFQNLVLKESALMEISSLKLETANGRLFIYGTDMDVSLRTEISEENYETVKPGAIAVRGHKLIDVLGTLSSSVKSIRLRLESNGWTSLLFGRSHFKISGIQAELFPAINFSAESSAESVAPVIFPAGLLLQFINSTGYAISTQDTRFALTGANLEVKGDRASMVATDGFRVASINAGIPGELVALFPKKAGSVLARLLSETDPQMPVEITGDPNRLYIAIGTKRLAFRKVVGQFPNIEPLLNTENDHMVTLSLVELKSAIRRADIFADKNNQSSVALTMRPGEVEIAAKSFEEGSGNELIDATYNGPEIKIKVKSSHLVDFFNSINTGENGGNPLLAMEFSDDEKRPTIWKVHKEGNLESAYDYQCLISKLR
jgi:DNA polymerase-3 subunit beta